MNPESEERPITPREWIELYHPARNVNGVDLVGAKRVDHIIWVGFASVLVVAAGVGAVLAMIELV